MGRSPQTAATTHQHNTDVHPDDQAYINQLIRTHVLHQAQPAQRPETRMPPPRPLPPKRSPTSTTHLAQP
eukprot:12891358-Prorocentrum_lima.AAC.1